ncbi:MAG TPA: hypothetical protein VFH94_04595 [Streptomyces sp.]|nr:hypothetical protein [Streptomyces sp.]
MLTLRRTALVTATPLASAAAGIAHPHGLSRSTAAGRAQLHVALLPVFPLREAAGADVLVEAGQQLRPSLGGTLGAPLVRVRLT